MGRIVAATPLAPFFPDACIASAAPHSTDLPKTVARVCGGAETFSAHEKQAPRASLLSFLTVADVSINRNKAIVRVPLGVRTRVGFASIECDPLSPGSQTSSTTVPSPSVTKLYITHSSFEREHCHRICVIKLCHRENLYGFLFLHKITYHPDHVSSRLTHE